MNSKILTLATLAALASSTPAFATSVGIPTQFLGIPPTDLMENNQPVTEGHLAGLALEVENMPAATPKQRADKAQATRDLFNRLSDLNPYESVIFKNQKFSASNVADLNYPADGAKVQFIKSMLDVSSESVHRSLVGVGSGTGTVSYQVFVSLRSHPALVTAALMRKLGYPIPSPKRYSELTIQFSSKDDRDNYLNEIADQTHVCRGRFMKYVPKNADEKAKIALDPCAKNDLLKDQLDASNDITLVDVVLQPGQINDYTAVLHWGVMTATTPKNRRQIRALIAPVVLADVNESVNLFATEMATIGSNQLILAHLYADQYQTTSITDIQWIAKRMANLTRQDMTEIVEAADYPHSDSVARPNDVEALVLEKLIGRQAQFLKLLGIKPGPSVDLNYNDRISSVNVKNGKLSVERYDGYAPRFSYADPLSPLRSDELSKFLQIEGLSSGLGEAMLKANEKLKELEHQFLSVDSVSDVAKKHANALRQQCFEQFQKTGTCSLPNKLWGGLIGGLSAQADRSIVSGTYYGGDAKVQLVDNVGVTANIGVFMTKDGLPKLNGLPISAAIEGNMSFTRNYVHVRPLASMAEATRDNWGNIYVPKFMDNLAAKLDVEINPDPTKPKPTDFLPDLKEGEMFIVTDSISVGAQASVGIPLAGILDFGVMGINPSLSVGVSAQKAIIRRTTILRTPDGLGVYMQRINSNEFDFNLNVNFWMQVLSYSQRNKHASAHTKAFLLGDNGDHKIADDKRKLLAIDLKQILKANNTEGLEGEFSHYELDHDMTTSIFEGRFLRWQWFGVNESHRVKVRKPAPDNTPDKERTLFSYKMVRTNGSNDAALLNDIASKYASGWQFLPTAGSNPADSFFGKGKWAIWKSEAELSPWHPSGIVSSAEHHWAGWKISRADMENIVSGIESKLKPLAATHSKWRQRILTPKGEVAIESPGPLVNLSTFATTNELQFYDISSRLLVYEAGMKQITDSIMDPNVSNEKIHDRLIEIETQGTEEGRKNFGKWCGQHDAPSFAPTFRGLMRPTPLLNSMPVSDEGVWFPVDRWGNHDSQDQNFYCVKPWMKWIMVERTKGAQTGEAKIKWSADVLRTLESTLPFYQLLNLMGNENYFFQIRIAGFRTNDPNGDSAYESSTLGTWNEDEHAGAFSDIATNEKITSSEMNATYLGTGY